MFFPIKSRAGFTFRTVLINCFFVNIFLQGESKLQNNSGQPFKLEKDITAGGNGAAVIATESIARFWEQGGITASFKPQADMVSDEGFDATTD